MSNALEEIINHLNGLDKHESATPVRLRPILRTLDSVNAIPYVQSFIIHLCDLIFKKSTIVLEKLCREFLFNQPEFYKSLISDEKISYPDLLNLTKKSFLDFLLKQSSVKTDKYDIENNEISIYFRTVCNKRPKQEDRMLGILDLFNYTITHDCQNPTNCNLINYNSIQLIGLFDGHNGPEAAEHCHHLAPYVLSQYLQYSLCTHQKYNIVDALGQTFHLLNTKLNGYRNRYRLKAGTTCTLCIISENSIFTGWVGDSSAWLVFREDSQVPLTNMLHRPSEGSEIIDVWNHGGHVTRISDYRFDRVDGVLAVTRALGDDRKIPGVSPLPSISRYDLNDSKKTPLCIVLASDGLWDTPGCDGPDIGVLCRQYLLEDNSMERVNTLTQILVDRAIKGGATDNVSIVILTFNKTTVTNGSHDRTKAKPSTPTYHYNHHQNILQAERKWSNRRITMFPEQLMNLRHCSENLANYIEARFHADNRMIQALQNLTIHTSFSNHPRCALSYEQRQSMLTNNNSIDRAPRSRLLKNSYKKQRSFSESRTRNSIRFSSPVRIIK